jgi:amino acid transporter
MPEPPESPAAPRRELGLFDSVCIIVGIIIGSGIFQTPSIVAGCVPGAWGVIGVWVAGGLFSLAGALSYAELASAYPRQGGEYVYLREAYGGWAGFLFGWAQMFVVLPAGIASVSFVFADYFGRLSGLPGEAGRFVAAGAIAALTAVNMTGVREGKWTQNVLTVAKAAGLLAVVAVALLGPAPAAGGGGPELLTADGLWLALILVLFTYGGWSEIVFVAAEVRDPRRNFTRAMAGGVGAVTGLYVLVNGAFLAALGQGKMGGSGAVAVDAVAPTFPAWAQRGIAALVCVSALGSANGLILTGSRVSYAMGAGHPSLRWLGGWHGRRGGPLAALGLQGALSLGLVLALGSFIEAVTYSVPVVWAFYLATGAALFVLRRRDPAAERPYRVWGYPVTPLLFCASCAFLAYSGITYSIHKRLPGPLVSAGVALLGLLVHGLTEGWRRPSPR